MEFVFVGGCTTELLLTDALAGALRTTVDVDVIAETATKAEYYRLGDRLRSLGFTEDTSLICRWQHPHLTLDVMPVEETILGFSNIWYQDAVATAVTIDLQPGLPIRVVTAPYFCATKIAAFHGRGKSDYMASSDIEDLIAVVDGRPELAQEIRSAEERVKIYLANEVSGFLAREQFVDALRGCLAPDQGSQERLPIVLKRLREIAGS